MKVQIRQKIGPRAHFRQKWKLFIKASDILVDTLMYAVIRERHFALQLDKGTVNTKCHFLYVACRFTSRKLLTVIIVRSFYICFVANCLQTAEEP